MGVLIDTSNYKRPSRNHQRGETRKRPHQEQAAGKKVVWMFHAIPDLLSVKHMMTRGSAVLRMVRR